VTVLVLLLALAGTPGLNRGETCPIPLFPCSEIERRRRTCANDTDEVSASISNSSESSHPGGFWGVWENENEWEREERLGKGLRLLLDDEGWFGGVNIVSSMYWCLKPSLPYGQCTGNSIHATGIVSQLT
jgi:hypothetical protein